jgi:hypothetical protein
MRQSTKQSIKAILKENEYTWDELAEVFCKECNVPDIEDFIYFLNERIKDK